VTDEDSMEIYEAQVTVIGRPSGAIVLQQTCDGVVTEIMVPAPGVRALSLELARRVVEPVSWDVLLQPVKR